MDPLSIAQMGASALGSLFSGLTSFGADQAQARAYKTAATQSLTESGVAASEKLQQGNAVAAQAATQAAANGGGLGGSALDVISNISDNAMFNARSAVYSGVTQANSDLYQSKVASDNATDALIGAGVQTTGSLLGSIMKNNSQQKYYNALSSMRGDAVYSQGYGGYGYGEGW